MEKGSSLNIPFISICSPKTVSGPRHGTLTNVWQRCSPWKCLAAGRSFPRLKSSLHQHAAEQTSQSKGSRCCLECAFLMAGAHTCDIQKPNSVERRPIDLFKRCVCKGVGHHLLESLFAGEVCSANPLQLFLSFWKGQVVNYNYLATCCQACSTGRDLVQLQPKNHNLSHSMASCSSLPAPTSPAPSFLPGAGEEPPSS